MSTRRPWRSDMEYTDDEIVKLAIVRASVNFIMDTSLGGE